MNSVLMQDAASERGFVANDASHSNINNLIDGLAWVSGIKPAAGTSVVSLGAVVSCILFLLFLTIFFLSKDILRQSFVEDTFTLAFFLSSLFFSSFIYFFTSLNVNYTTIRYFYIPLLPILIYVIIKMLCARNVLVKLGVSCLLITSAIGVGILGTQNNQVSQVEANEQAVSILAKSTNGTYAATYWNAQKYEFISNGKLKALPILLDPSVCVKAFSWLVETDRTTSQAKTIPLLLDTSEYATLMSFKCDGRLTFLNPVGNLNLYEYQGKW